MPSILGAKRSKMDKLDEHAQKEQGNLSLVESRGEDSNLPKLNASTLKKSEVLKIFDLKHDTTNTQGIFDHAEDDSKLIPVPDQLSTKLLPAALDSVIANFIRIQTGRCS